MKRGVQFKQQMVGSLDEVAEMTGERGVIVNATGLGMEHCGFWDCILTESRWTGSRFLKGIEDIKVYPIRGQTVLVRTSSATIIEDIDYIPRKLRMHFLLDHCIDSFRNLSVGARFNPEATYVIPRPSPSGLDTDLIVGGTFLPNNWDTTIDMNAAERILERAKVFVPAIGAPDTEVLSYNVGLRPAREGGPRVEREVMNFPLSGKSGIMEGRKQVVVHAYGFGCVSVLVLLPFRQRLEIYVVWLLTQVVDFFLCRPAGYQQCWGAAGEAARLVRESLIRD